MSKRVYIGLFVLIFAIFLGLAYNVTRSMSPTYDEQNHLTRGIAILKTGDFRLSLHHPPLPNVLNALPVMIGSEYWWNDKSDDFTEKVDSFNPESEEFLNIWTAASEVLYENQTPALGIKAIKASRVMTLLFALLAGVIIFLWAKELFGPLGGIISATIFLFDPNVIAHATVTTTDMAAVATILLAVYLLRKYIQSPSAKTLIFCGIAVGMAFLCKFSSLILLPIFGLILLFNIHGEKISKRLFNALVSGILMLFVAGVVLFVGYGFKVEKFAAKPGDSFSQQYEGKGNLPVPAKQYLRGLKTLTGEADGHKAYLNGVSDDTGKGWWYYFPATFVYKTNWVALALILITIVLFALPTCREKVHLSKDEALFLGIPILIYLLAGFGLLGISLNLGVRHLLPIYPFIYIFVGAVGKAIDFHDVKGKIIVLLVMLSYGMIIATNHPNYLSYFNISNADRYLIDSNFDWGQDIEKMTNINTEGLPLYFSYFGTTTPVSARLECYYMPGMGVMTSVNMQQEIKKPSFFAISATCLRGGEVYTGVNHEKFLRENSAEFVQMVGKTIYLYKIP